MGSVGGVTRVSVERGRTRPNAAKTRDETYPFSSGGGSGLKG